MLVLHSVNYTFNESDVRWCYVAGRPEACVRISILVLLGIITGVLCLARVIQYHCYRAKNYHQYPVYYIAILICLLSIVRWGYASTSILDLVNTFLVVVQMLVISWFFYSWAFRILQLEKLFKFCIFPLLVGVLIYFTGCLIWASVNIGDNSIECTQPPWLLFSSSQLVLAQFFLLSVVYITRKLNDIRTMRTNRFSQKAQLWGLALMYEVISATTFAYDVYLLTTKGVDHQCGSKFKEYPVVVTMMYIIHKIVKYLLPQFTICVVFAPLKTRPPFLHQKEFEETDNLSWADKPDYKSTFYSNSGDTQDESEDEIVVPLSINNTNPIFPRSTPRSSSYQSSPWIRPGHSWRLPTNTASPLIK